MGADGCCPRGSHPDVLTLSGAASDVRFPAESRLSSESGSDQGSASESSDERGAALDVDPWFYPSSVWRVGDMNDRSLICRALEIWRAHVELQSH